MLVDATANVDGARQRVKSLTSAHHMGRLVAIGLHAG